MIRLTQGASPIWVNPKWVKTVKPAFPYEVGTTMLTLWSETWPLVVDETPEQVIEALEQQG